MARGQSAEFLRRMRRKFKLGEYQKRTRQKRRRFSRGTRLRGAGLNPLWPSGSGSEDRALLTAIAEREPNLEYLPH